MHVVVMRFFVNTGDGVEYCDTQEEAIALAQKAIDEWRDCCDPEWPEEVENVCWGPVLGESTMIDIEDGQYANYELTDSPIQWRCNLCGGLVSFDGTKPTRLRHHSECETT